MPDRVIHEYNRYAADVVITTFFTVMLWIAAQQLITEAAKNYLPSLLAWQLSAIEVFIASYGLWYVAKAKKKNGDSVFEETKKHAIEGCPNCKKWLEEHHDTLPDMQKPNAPDAI